MGDFREKLYERYHSTFKKTSVRPTQASHRSYERWARHTILPLLDGVDREAPILEIGCGPGDFLALLRNEGFANLTGIDVSEEQAELAVARNLPVQCADVTPFLETKSGEYAAIIALDFVEHFTKDELFVVLPRIHGALRHHGLFILQTPNGQGLFSNQVVYGDLTHMTIFNPGSLGQILRRIGFDELLFRETGPDGGSTVGVVRKVLWSLIRCVASGVRRIETGKTQRIWTENLLCRCRRP